MAISLTPPEDNAPNRQPAEADAVTYLAIEGEGKFAPFPARQDVLEEATQAEFWPTPLERIEHAYDRFKAERPMRQAARAQRAERLLQLADRVEPRRIWVGLGVFVGAVALLAGPRDATPTTPGSHQVGIEQTVSNARLQAAVDQYTGQR